MKLDFTLQYRITNRAVSTEEFEVIVAQNISMEKEFPGQTAIRYVWAKYEEANDLIFRVENPSTHSPDELYLLFKRLIPLQPEQSAIVKFKTTRIELSESEEPYLSLYPSKGMQITIDHPADLEILIEPFHPLVPESLRPVDDIVEGDRRRKSFLFDLPTLPYWSHNVLWRPTKAPTPTKAEVLPQESQES